MKLGIKPRERKRYRKKGRKRRTKRHERMRNTNVNGHEETNV